MMMKCIVLSFAVVSIAGCASGGRGSSGGMDALSGAGGTGFSSPSQFSSDEFAKEPKKYAKKWVKYNGGGVDSFKKVTIPSYTMEMQTRMYKVGYNKMAALLANADGAKSSVTMVVTFPWEQHKDILTDVATTSYNRLKEKFRKAGVEVVEWSQVVASNKKAADFNVERLSTEPVVTGESAVSIMAPGTARLKTGMWAFAASSLSRNAEISLIFPNFGVGFGYFDGTTNPNTISEAHGMSSINFTPQLQILSGSGFAYQSKWDVGAMALDRTAVVDEGFVKKLVKEVDTRQAADGRGESRRQLAMALNNAKSHEVKVSTSASVSYALEVDADKYKALLLTQLENAENLIVERYKNEF